MRVLCLGLLLLFAAAAGCASPDSDSPGFFGNYGGFPWQSLIKKNADQNNDDAYVPPTYRGADRFARQPGASLGSVSPNPAATGAPEAQAPANQASAGE